MLNTLAEAAKKALAGYAAFSVAGPAIARAAKLEEKKAKEGQSSTFNYDDPIFETRGDAEKCIAILKELIDTYGCATVADMYQASGLEYDLYYTMNKYGWTDLEDSKIYRTRHGYIIDLPKATRIGIEESDSQ